MDSFQDFVNFCLILLINIVNIFNIGSQEISRDIKRSQVILNIPSKWETVKICKQCQECKSSASIRTHFWACYLKFDYQNLYQQKRNAQKMHNIQILLKNLKEWRQKNKWRTRFRLFALAIIDFPLFVLLSGVCSSGLRRVFMVGAFTWGMVPMHYTILVAFTWGMVPIHSCGFFIHFALLEPFDVINL